MTASQRMSTERQRQQGRDAAQLARRRACRASSTRCACASTPARRASPCTRARTRGTSRQPTCATIASVLRAAARRDRVQHRRRSAARSARRWSREVRPDQCTLVPVRAGRDHEPGGLAARHAGGGCRRRSSASCRQRGVRVSLFVDPEPRAGALGGVARRRSRRALHRAVRARVRARRADAAARASRATPTRRTLAHALGLGVNAGHDLDLDNLVAVPHAAAPRRSVDRPRAHQPRAVRRPGPRGARHLVAVRC